MRVWLLGPGHSILAGDFNNWQPLSNPHMFLQERGQARGVLMFNRFECNETANTYGKPGIQDRGHIPRQLNRNLGLDLMAPEQAPVGETLSFVIIRLTPGLIPVSPGPALVFKDAQRGVRQEVCDET